MNNHSSGREAMHHNKQREQHFSVSKTVSWAAFHRAYYFKYITQPQPDREDEARIWFGTFQPPILTTDNILLIIEAAALSMNRLADSQKSPAFFEDHCENITDKIMKAQKGRFFTRSGVIYNIQRKRTEFLKDPATAIHFFDLSFKLNPAWHHNCATLKVLAHQLHYQTLNGIHRAKTQEQLQQHLQDMQLAARQLTDTLIEHASRHKNPDENAYQMLLYFWKNCHSLLDSHPYRPETKNWLQKIWTRIFRPELILSYSRQVI